MRSNFYKENLNNFQKINLKKRMLQILYKTCIYRENSVQNNFSGQTFKKNCWTISIWILKNFKHSKQMLHSKNFHETNASFKEPFESNSIRKILKQSSKSILITFQKKKLKKDLKHSKRINSKTHDCNKLLLIILHNFFFVCRIFVFVL